MKIALCFFTSLLVLSFFSPARAEVFQYFDEEGTLIVTDRPFPGKKPARMPYRENRNSRLAYRDDISYEFYEVSGSSFPELASDARRKGPYDAREKKRYVAQTQWKYGLSYRITASYRVEGAYVYATVFLSDIACRPDIVVLLPALSQGTELSAEDGDLWERFMKGLLEHEHDHVRIVRESLTGDIEKRISAIRDIIVDYNSAGNIDAAIEQAVEARTSEIAHEAIRNTGKRNEEYDEMTRHGEKPELRGRFFDGY